MIMFEAFNVILEVLKICTMMGIIIMITGINMVIYKILETPLDKKEEKE